MIRFIHCTIKSPRVFLMTIKKTYKTIDYFICQPQKADHQLQYKYLNRNFTESNHLIPFLQPSSGHPKSIFLLPSHSLHLVPLSLAILKNSYNLHILTICRETQICTSDWFMQKCFSWLSRTMTAILDWNFKNKENA